MQIYYFLQNDHFGEEKTTQGASIYIYLQSFISIVINVLKWIKVTTWNHKVNYSKQTWLNVNHQGEGNELHFTIPQLKVFQYKGLRENIIKLKQYDKHPRSLKKSWYSGHIRE